jgi:microcompartment protein CcmL/EutN
MACARTAGPFRIATRLFLAALAVGAADGHQAATRLGAVSRSRLGGARAAAVRMASKAEVIKELVVPVPVEQLYAMLSDFSRYQDIGPGEYQSVQVISSKKAERGRKEIHTVEFRHKPVWPHSMRVFQPERARAALARADAPHRASPRAVSRLR